ncbi:MAG TPA: hypothetical protein VE954_02105 [Oligoflexus sp.]|uniref:hypothetical protein n=1 Tax=Oligoflexus sp. TaxID=1971216 RepID=UPI002D6546A6|nr:hypothetical protein [Oligoflexus sp.]HYX31879.1 hypothetical protein [Oligoflexus sp.]
MRNTRRALRSAKTRNMALRKSRSQALKARFAGSTPKPVMTLLERLFEENQIWGTGGTLSDDPLKLPLIVIAQNTQDASKLRVSLNIVKMAVEASKISDTWAELSIHADLLKDLVLEAFFEFGPIDKKYVREKIGALQGTSFQSSGVKIRHLAETYGNWRCKDDESDSVNGRHGPGFLRSEIMQTLA